MEQRLLVISPVHNEASHIERVVRAVAAQRRQPDAWIVVDDASTDTTLELLVELQRELDFMTVLSAPPKPTVHGGDRLAHAAEISAFHHGLDSLDWRSFTHISKLDGDIELPVDWYERLLAHFAQDPALGIACGQLEEITGGGSHVIPIPPHHVHGAVKLYSKSCLETIGGIEERLGWDTLDEVYARMNGLKTCSFEGPVAIHLRPFASRGGVLRGRARHGVCAYISHQTLPWVTARAVKVGRAPPAGIGGAAFLFGYIWAALKRTERCEDPALRRFVRRELRERVRGAIAPPRLGQAS